MLDILGQSSDVLSLAIRGESTYVANLPFELTSSEVQDVIAEKFERPVRVVCLKRGPPVPFRRQSAYIHFATGEKPSSTGVTP